MKRDEITYYILAVFGAVCLIAALIANAVNGSDEKPEAVVVPDIEAETEAEVETVPANTVFAPITEAETKTAAPDTTDNSPKTDERNEETTQNVSGSDFDAAFSDEDLLYLAKIVQNEAGSDFCSDAHQRAVASVVLNRVADPRFPDTIIGVITQGWNGECALQYAVGGWERFNALEPSERAIENARYVLENGVTVDGAIWQAEFIQGEIVAEFAYPAIYDTVTYICR